VGPRIDARAITAGGNINFDQRSGNFYYVGQDTSALPRADGELISELLTKLHRKTVPLSECVAEAYGLALNYSFAKLNYQRPCSTIVYAIGVT
jgi:hypothetical protein